ncbi:MAG: hypothetical protein M1617_06800 [Actinobacteria bacterium]|nr:hypothetical protein [Actinomycetota bacterium]MCL5887978.1 hypothetical protein [Actinomycetota bacterium]
MRCRTGAFVGGMLLGIGLGALLGVLFAPVPGVEARRRLSARAVIAAEAARTMAQDAELAVSRLGARVDNLRGVDDAAVWRRVNEIRDRVRSYDTDLSNLP